MNQLSLDIRAEKRRFTGQCGMILGRLTRGRVTNDELSRIARNYTGRVSDLRAKGHDIRVVSRSIETGLTWYSLFVDGEEVPR